MNNNVSGQKNKNMQKVKNKDSRIELMLRHELWVRGVRYRKNVTRIIGKPDIAFIGKRVAVFCDSEFWHGYDWEKQKEKIKTNREFWIPKIERNIERDKEITETLEADGWIVLRFWGNEIIKHVGACANVIVNVLEERNRCN
jgi:DNA mismatch endonuclease vsr